MSLATAREVRLGLVVLLTLAALFGLVALAGGLYLLLFSRYLQEKARNAPL